MRLRILKLKDAPLMLEWMHDESIVIYMDTDFHKKTLEDCEEFIRNNQHDEINVHRAIVDDNDTYMGTVSLKNIDKSRNKAEFAITVRVQAMGKGFSKFGMEEIIRLGFEDLGLDSIYWYVKKENHRAIHFYNKNGYCENEVEDTVMPKDYIWYAIRREKTLKG